MSVGENNCVFAINIFVNNQTKGVLLRKKYWNKFTTVIVLLFVVVIAVACSSNNDTADESANGDSASGSTFEAGTYEGVGEGYAGDITANVTVTESEITDIELDMPEETPSISSGAEEQIVSDILESQGLGVDTVSGATGSSTGIIAAVTAALEKAGADIEELKAKSAGSAEDVAIDDFETDVVVIGTGGAGMAAAIEVSEAGKEVVILEKMPIIGGNTNFATGGMNASETSVQEAEGIEDSNDVFFQDTMEGGKDVNDEELVQTLVDQSAEAIDWINELGAGLNRVSLSGGATNPRIHTPKDGSAVGPVVIDTLSQKLEDLGVQTYLNTTATKLIEEDGKVVGVEAEDPTGVAFTVTADSVIIAAGGFGANMDMIREYREDLKDFSTTNHDGATGDGVTMALEVGAGLTDIGEIQTHPTTNPENGSLYTEGLRGDGAILINLEGERFTDELETRDVVSQNILAQTDGVAYLITNDAIRSENAALDGYINKGSAVEGETVEELASALEIDPATLQNTLDTYEEAFKAVTTLNSAASTSKLH